MTEQEIKNIVETQRAYFRTGATLPVCTRIQALMRLKKCIQAHEAEINAALKADLGKSSFESYMCETGLVLSEITYMLKHVRSLAREKTVTFCAPLRRAVLATSMAALPAPMTLTVSPRL